MESKPIFTVPDPQPPAISEVLANKEIAGFEKDESGMNRGTVPKIIFHILRSSLFAFALGVNVWWDHHVLAIVWQAGRVGSGYHLSDSVLIALVTTSVANFLALIFIIARHLFPSKISN